MFFKKPVIDISSFYAAGGRPTAKEWASWTQEQRELAMICQSRLTNYYLLLFRFSISNDHVEKLAIADEMKEFDSGSISRSIRQGINRRAMEED